MRLKQLLYRLCILHSSDSHLTVFSVGYHIIGTSWILVSVTSTHLEIRFAPVTTQSGLMIEPPHAFLPMISTDT